MEIAKTESHFMTGTFLSSMPYMCCDLVYVDLTPILQVA